MYSSTIKCIALNIHSVQIYLSSACACPKGSVVNILLDRLQAETENGARKRGGLYGVIG